MVPTMNPFTTGAAGFLMKKSACDEFRSPVLYMGTMQPNEPSPSGHQHVGQIHRIVPYPPSFTWWEGHLALQQRQALHDFSCISLLCRRHRCDIDLLRLNRTGDNDEESVGRTVSPASAPIMKVARAS